MNDDPNKDDKYTVWFYAFPISNIPQEEVIEIFLNNFKQSKADKKTINFNEFVKAMYPNCLKNSLTYDIWFKNLFYFFFQTLEELNNFKYNSLFVFILACNEETFLSLYRKHSDGSFSEIEYLLDKSKFKMTCCSTENLDLLTVDNFPDILSYIILEKLNKSQMNEKTKGHYPIYKKIYISILHQILNFILNLII